MKKYHLLTIAFVLSGYASFSISHGEPYATRCEFIEAAVTGDIDNLAQFFTATNSDNSSPAISPIAASNYTCQAIAEEVNDNGELLGFGPDKERVATLWFGCSSGNKSQTYSEAADEMRKLSKELDICANILKLSGKINAPRKLRKHYFNYRFGVENANRLSWIDYEAAFQELKENFQSTVKKEHLNHQFNLYHNFYSKENWLNFKEKLAQ